MNTVRVLVVEDSLTIRKFLVEVLSSDRHIEVIGEAEDGKRAIELCEALRPDVVTMDMMLPVMSGVAATEYIMAYFPTPILVVSASVNRGEVFRTYEALAAGAVDALDKPKFDENAPEWQKKFIAAVKMVSRIKVITHPRGRMRATRRIESSLRDLPATRQMRAICIGGSTGAPAAIADILRVLPGDFPIPIFVVIHISDQFAFALAEWLGTQSRVPVRFARTGERVPQVGTPGVVLAPGGYHLRVEDGAFRLWSGPERHSCRPAVDELFESAAAEFGGQFAACLLTGMGKDGAAGMLAARRAGALTIAQDEATSIVFGMPAEAIRLNAAELVLPLPQIAPQLLKLVAETVPQGK